MDKSQIRVGDVLRADWDSSVYKIRCIGMSRDPNTIHAEVLEPRLSNGATTTFATLNTLGPWHVPCPMEVNHEIQGR